MKKSYLILFLFSLLCGNLCTCSNSSIYDSGQNISPLKTQHPSEETAEIPQVFLMPGDVLDIKFYYDSTLNETVTIRPDGKISLQLIDEFQAAGKTPKELDTLLTQMYSKFLKKPEIAVIVKGLENQLVYVGGEVVSPKLVPLKGRLSALQAILYVGGTKESAKLSNVIIIRDKGNKNPEIFKANLKKAIADGQGDILLKPYDIVYVPKTTIAKVDVFVEQYINQIIPRSVSVSFPFLYYLNPKDLQPEIRAEAAK